jgi:ribosomal protein S18 acetylase RimI-like enzyme
LLSNHHVAVHVRELSASDKAVAVGLWERTDLTRPWNPPGDDFDRALAGPTSTVLGGFDGERLVSTAMVGHDGHRGWVYYVATEPERQRSGVGRQIMEAAEAWLVERGAVKLNLMVRNTNESALGFYRRSGYEDADVSVLAKWLHRPPR